MLPLRILPPRTESLEADDWSDPNKSVRRLVTDVHFAAEPSQSASISRAAGYGPRDNTTVTVVLCTVNVFPCPGINTKASLTPAVNPATGA